MPTIKRLILIDSVTGDDNFTVCAPNVWREDEQVKYEILDTAKNASILAEMC